MITRELYVPPAGPGVAQVVRGAYIDGALGREEVWSSQSASDSPHSHQRRRSTDNGRTWSPLAPMDTAVVEELPEGGLVTYPRQGEFDLKSGSYYQRVLRRAWPGLPPYSYHWGKGHEHPFNDHMFMSIAGGREELLRYEEGPDFDSANPFDPVYSTTNRAYPGSGMAFAADGTAYYPIVSYKLGNAYSLNGGGVRLMRRGPGDAVWQASEPRYLSAEQSSRGVLEPDVALLRDGRLLVVCRGSDTPSTPGRKWMCVSEDGGRTLSAIEQFRYDDGSSFYSPSSIHRFLRSTRNGKLYWLANIIDAPPRGNGPRYPLCLAEIDETTLAVIKDSLIVVDDRQAGDSPKLQLSNWTQLENRETLDWEFYLTRIGQNGDNFWESGVYRYTFTPPR